MAERAPEVNRLSDGLLGALITAYEAGRADSRSPNYQEADQLPWLTNIAVSAEILQLRTILSLRKEGYDPPSADLTQSILHGDQARRAIIAQGIRLQLAQTEEGNSWRARFSMTPRQWRGRQRVIMNMQWLSIMLRASENGQTPRSTSPGEAGRIARITRDMNIIRT